MLKIGGPSDINKAPEKRNVGIHEFAHLLAQDDDRFAEAFVEQFGPEDELAQHDQDRGRLVVREEAQGGFRNAVGRREHRLLGELTAHTAGDLEWLHLGGENRLSTGEIHYMAGAPGGRIQRRQGRGEVRRLRFIRSALRSAVGASEGAAVGE